MTIPQSSVVNVDIQVGATFPARAGFGTLNIMTDEEDVIPVTERIREYSDITGVAADWGAGTKANAAATAYFSQEPKPTSLKISTRFTTAQSAALSSSNIIEAEKLAELILISNGSLLPSDIDGSSAELTTLDFTSDTTMDEVASRIETALQTVESGTTFVWTGTEFICTSPTTGVSSTMGFFVTTSTGTDLGPILNMTQANGKLLAVGIDPETITESLTAVEAIDPDWYGLTFTNEFRDITGMAGDDIVAVSAFIEARQKVFLCTTNDLNVLDSQSTSDVAFVNEAAGNNKTMMTFSRDSSLYPSCSIAGRAFTVDFSQPNSTITLKFKQGPGITSEDISTSQKATLDAKKCNAFIIVGNSDMYAESFMGSGIFFDERHGLDWLKDAIETQLFGYLLTRATKVPYTDKGTTALQQQLIDVLAEAKLNGLIAPGTTIEGVFLPEGYITSVTPVADINQSDKDARNFPGLQATIIGAGAIHSVQVNVTFER